MTKANNPAGLSHEEILALRAQSGAPGHIGDQAPVVVQRQAAPDISVRAPKVTVPQIRTKEGDLMTEAGQEKIRGPRLEFVTQQEKIRAAERLELLEAEERRREEREAMRPDKILSRVAFLEREVKRLAAALKKMEKS